MLLKRSETVSEPGSLVVALIVSSQCRVVLSILLDQEPSFWVDWDPMDG
jgi:hypothetical protein